MTNLTKINYNNNIFNTITINNFQLQNILKLLLSMKKYIFATDVDGTMLMDNGKVHPETLEAFKKAKELGHIVVIATGRAVKRTKLLLEIMPYVNYFVCNNGAVVHDVEKDDSFIVHGINPKYYSRVYDFAKENNAIFKLHTNKDWIGFAENDKDNPTPLTPELDKKIREHIRKNPNDEKLFNGQIITALAIYSTNEFCLKYFPFFKKEFGIENSVFLTNGVYLDVNPKNRSKWQGLLDLAKKLNISENNIVTFGDSGNDIEMIVNAGKNGFALENSQKDLLEVASQVIGSNNTNAIGKKILEYIEQK